MFKNKYIRFILFLVAILLLLLLLLAVLIRVPAVQNYAQQKVLQTLSEKYDADWQIEELKISFVDQIAAKGILLKDQASKTMLSADEIRIDIGLFSLLNKEFIIDDITIVNAQGNLYELPDGQMNYDFILAASDKGETDQKTDASNTADAWSLDLQRINLEQIGLDYHTKDLAFTIKQDLLHVDFEKIDFNNQTLAIAKLESKNSYTSVPILPPNKGGPSILPDLGWKATINKLEMYHRLIEIGDTELTRISELNFKAQELDYHADSLMIDVKELNGNYNDQLKLQEGFAKLSIHQNKIDANKITLRTTSDQIIADQLSVGLDSKTYDLKNLNSDVSYDLLKFLNPYITDDLRLIKGEKLRGQVNALHYDPDRLQIDNIDLKYGAALNIKGSVNMKAPQGDFQNPTDLQVNIDMLKSDLQQLDGMLRAFTIPDSLQKYQYLTASGIATGNLKILTLDQFSIAVDDAINAKVNGTIRNINRPDDLSYDLLFAEANFNTLQLPIPAVDKVDIVALGQVNYVGKLSGDKDSIRVDGKLESALGNAEAKIVLGIKDGIDNLAYKGDLSLSQFDLGTLLKDESLGKITLNTTVNGRGTTLQKGNTNFTGFIKDFQYRGYTYNLIKVDAHVEEGQIDGVIDIDDPNALLQYDGTIFLDKELSTFDFSVNIDTINLNTLNLYPEEISLSGKLESQFSLPLPERDPQIIIVKDLNLSNLTENFYEDSIVITALRKVDSTFLEIDSDIMQLHMDGIYQVADLPASTNDLVKKYIDTDTIIAHPDITSKNIHLYGELNTLLPFKILLVDQQLQSKPMIIDLKLDFQENSLEGQIEVDSFYYDKFFSEKIFLTAASSGHVIDLDIEGDMNVYNGTPINKLNLSNRINNNEIESVLSALDKNDNRMIKVSTQTRYSPEKIMVAIQDGLILNNQDWEVMRDNLIEIKDNCITISNFEIVNGIERIRVNSDLKNPNELSVLFDSFEIGELTDLLLTNGSTASGTINGNIDIKDLCTAPSYIANLAIRDIVYDSTYVGLLEIAGDADPRNSLIRTDLSLIGPTNRLVGTANYNTATRGIDIDVGFDSLQLLLIDPFLEDIMRESDGHISGEIKVGGNIDEPELSGFAELHNTVTTIVANNTRYSLNDHVINFDNKSIDIGELVLYDEDKNKAKITGKIYHTYLQDMDVALKLDTEKFIFLNTTIKDNPVFSGRVLLDAEGEITGPPNLLNVNVSARSLEETEILISPYSAETYLQEDFITYGKPQDFEDLTDEYLLQLAQKFPFDVTLDLNVSEESKLTLVVDPINGDKVVGRGSGNLKMLLDPYGEQKFYGKYTVADGIYNFTYGTFISKAFDIKEGGSVSFTGSLLDAEVDISAVHKVYTTTYELIKNDAALDAEDIKRSQSRTDVDVYLTLQGPLSNTDILLDIRVPELESSSLTSPIDRSLTELREDPNELNNQVFGLLLFNSFLVTQNTSNGIGDIGSSIALSSISELISNQLNKLAQNKIKGVDVNFNVNSYDSEYVNKGAGGNVTEVGLQVSKQLFNDRLSVSATGNVDLEENDQDGYSSVVGDFVLEYKLTEDGQYRIRVFSKTDYDRLLNENNNKNGVSLYFKKSFDSKRN